MQFSVVAFCSCRNTIGLAASLVFVLAGILVAEEPQPTPLLEWGKGGEAAGEFYSPIGIAFNSKSELFVTDLNNARVQKFSPEGKHLGSFNVPRDKPERKSTILGESRWMRPICST